MWSRHDVKKKVTRQHQMSDSLILALFLAFSGGLQDAYTYVIRDHVFANGQTGNMILMGMGFLKGDWRTGVRYLIPVLAFAAGIFLTDIIGSRYKEARLLHWRQGILLLEIALMAGVGLLSQEHNILANCMVSFACAFQVQAFRKVCGNVYTSTMCVGNLRSGTAALSAYLRNGHKKDRDKVGCYFSVIFVFIAGAGAGGLLAGMLKEQTIWISCVMLLVCFLLVELDRPAG